MKITIRGLDEHRKRRLEYIARQRGITVEQLILGLINALIIDCDEQGYFKGF